MVHVGSSQGLRGIGTSLPFPVVQWGLQEPLRDQRTPVSCAAFPPARTHLSCHPCCADASCHVFMLSQPLPEHLLLPEVSTGSAPTRLGFASGFCLDGISSIREKRHQGACQSSVCASRPGCAGGCLEAPWAAGPTESPVPPVPPSLHVRAVSLASPPPQRLLMGPGRPTGCCPPTSQRCVHPSARSWENSHGHGSWFRGHVKLHLQVFPHSLTIWTTSSKNRQVRVRKPQVWAVLEEPGDPTEVGLLRVPPHPPGNACRRVLPELLPRVSLWVEMQGCRAEGR